MIQQLPDEMIHMIANLLPFKDTVQFSQTCRRMRRVVGPLINIKATSIMSTLDAAMPRQVLRQDEIARFLRLQPRVTLSQFLEHAIIPSRYGSNFGLNEIGYAAQNLHFLISEKGAYHALPAFSQDIQTIRNEFDGRWVIFHLFHSLLYFVVLLTILHPMITGESYDDSYDPVDCLEQAINHVAPASFILAVFAVIYGKTLDEHFIRHVWDLQFCNEYLLKWTPAPEQSEADQQYFECARRAYEKYSKLPLRRFARVASIPVFLGYSPILIHPILHNIRAVIFGTMIINETSYEFVPTYPFTTLFSYIFFYFTLSHQLNFHFDSLAKDPRLVCELEELNHAALAILAGVCSIGVKRGMILLQSYLPSIQELQSATVSRGLFMYRAVRGRSARTDFDLEAARPHLRID